MTEAEKERAAIVAWLRQPAWANLGFWKRLDGAIRFFFRPEEICEAVARNIASRIQNREHLTP